MMKLHGSPLSNFYNMAKHSLMEKRVDFTEILTMPSQEEEYLSISPMGKIPCLETNQGCLVETNVIMDYLEDAYPEPKLYPADVFQRAKAKELMRFFEHYVDAPARRHLPEILFGAERSEEAYIQAKPLLQRGLAAIERRAKFAPYLCGDQFGFADIFAVHALKLATLICSAVYDWNVLDEIPGLAEWNALVESRESSQQVFAVQQQALEAFHANRA